MSKKNEKGKKKKKVLIKNRSTINIIGMHDML